MEPSSANKCEEVSHHMRDIGNIPLLSAETEHSLCRRWIDHHDIAAAHQLVRSHRRLATDTALAYRGRGLPIEDLIGEGHVGLMRAVCRFDPECGTRFATYAAWWVRDAIQQYMFFNLHRVLGQSRAAAR
jgi:RNA polymerase sigma-32 factor